MKKKIYIAGPMSGIENFNSKEFYKWEKLLRESGFKVINPLEISKEIAMKMQKNLKDISKEVYLKADIRKLVRCSHILMLTGWKNSEGAKLEHEIAKKCKINIIYEGKVDSLNVNQ